MSLCEYCGKKAVILIHGTYHCKQCYEDLIPYDERDKNDLEYAE